MLHISLALSLNGEESLKKLSDPDPDLHKKLNQFILVTHTTCPPNFVRIRPQLFEISCYKLGQVRSGQVWEHAPEQ